MKEVLVKTEGLKKYYSVGSQVVKALDGVDAVTKNGIGYPYYPVCLYRNAF